MAVTVVERVGVVADSVVVTVWVFDVVAGAAAAVAVFDFVVLLGTVWDVDSDVVVSLEVCVVVVGALTLVVVGALAVRLFSCCVRLVAMLWPVPEPHPATTIARSPTSATWESTDRLDPPIRSTARA